MPAWPKAVAQSVSQAAVASVQVAVVDPSGAKVPQATVVVFQAHTANNSVMKTVRTDRRGELELELPAGEYVLRVSAPGFLQAEQSVKLSGEASPQVIVRLRVAAKEETVDVAGEETGEGSASNGQALVLSGNRLAALSTNPSTLQQQINALVQTDDGSAPELRVDGFSNGRLPPKANIREIRVNQNAFSAQFDRRGNTVVEIFTKPGTDKLHGDAYLSGNGDSLNARNPFLATKPAYHSIYGQANVTGALGKRTSFVTGVDANNLENQVAINARVLDSGLNIVPFAQAVAAPAKSRSANLRVDHQFGEKNTLTARAEFASAHQTNAELGDGQLLLQTQGFTSDSKTFTLQVGNTTIVSPRVVAETRFQYRRLRTEQDPNSTATSVVVQGAFSGGGSNAQTIRDATDNYEFQEYLSVDRGRHFLRAGMRYRLSRDSNASTANFNGQYTFTSIGAYQATLRGIAAGQTPAQIRASGGGASQFNVTSGTPGAVVSTGDLGLYLEDEWKATPSLTLTSGLRFESQYGIPDHADPAPRLAFAWVVKRSGAPRPLVVLRGGVGFFYERFEAGNLLTATRQNGVLQRSYYLQNPDTFPSVVASGASLTSIAPTVYQLDPHLRSPYVLTEGLSAQRTLGRLGMVSVAFSIDHGTHQWMSRNANAPLNGVRPLGETQNVYQFASLGTSDNRTLSVNHNAQFGAKGGMWLNYTLRFRKTDGWGPGTFVSNSYDVSADYGRTPSLARHRVFVGGWASLPWKFSASMFLSAHSATRFNVTTGQDNNGDSIYNDRPAFATDLSRPSVVRTAFGDFDTAPVAGQPRVPVSYGLGPSFVSLQGQVGRDFMFGPVQPQEPSSPGSPVQPEDRLFHCTIGIEGQNVLNHTNRSTPIGQLTSPYFGQSLSLNSEQTGSTAANRVVSAWLSFRF